MVETFVVVHRFLMLKESVFSPAWDQCGDNVSIFFLPVDVADADGGNLI